MTASPSRPRLPQTVREMQPHAERAAQLLRSLATEQRLRLLCNLLEGPLSVSELNYHPHPLTAAESGAGVAVIRTAWSA